MEFDALCANIHFMDEPMLSGSDGKFGFNGPKAVHLPSEAGAARYDAAASPVHMPSGSPSKPAKRSRTSSKPSTPKKPPTPRKAGKASKASAKPKASTPASSKKSAPKKKATKPKATTAQLAKLKALSRKSSATAKKPTATAKGAKTKAAPKTSKAATPRKTKAAAKSSVKSKPTTKAASSTQKALALAQAKVKAQAKAKAAAKASAKASAKSKPKVTKAKANVAVPRGRVLPSSVKNENSFENVCARSASSVQPRIADEYVRRHFISNGVRGVPSQQRLQATGQQQRSAQMLRYRQQLEHQQQQQALQRQRRLREQQAIMQQRAAMQTTQRVKKEAMQTTGRAPPVSRTDVSRQALGKARPSATNATQANRPTARMKAVGEERKRKRNYQSDSLTDLLHGELPQQLKKEQLAYLSR